MQRKEEESTSFVQEYYKALTRNPKHLVRFYPDDSTLTFLKESEEHSSIQKNIVQEIIDKHQRKVEKVLVCSIDSHILSDLMFISVIGQFVYSNYNTRFSQQFVVKNKKILVDNTRILDEEIVYSNKPGKYRSYLLKVKGMTNRQNVFEVFAPFGRINYIKPSDNEFLVEFAKYEDAMKVVNDEGLRNKGIMIEVGEENQTNN